MRVDFVTSTTYDQPVLYYDKIGSIPATSIRLRLNKYGVISRAPKTVLFSGIPLINTSTNNASKGVELGEGASELPKLTLAGWIDTPMVSIGNNLATPTLQWSNGNTLTYGDFIALCMEGRASQSTSTRPIIDPVYFRDPYGRVYFYPRILDFQATYVEAVPGRQEFQMTLQLTRGWDI